MKRSGKSDVNPLSELEAEDLRALVEFKAQRNAGWKFALLAGWERAKYAGPLQRIRNQYGPAWLAKVKDAHFDSLPPRPLALIEVTGHWLEAGMSVPAYSNGDRWNNFAKPFFTLDGMRKLASLMPATLKEEQGFFTLHDEYGVSEIRAVDKLIDGNSVSLYTIDDWSWEEAEGAGHAESPAVAPGRPRMR